MLFSGVKTKKGEKKIDQKIKEQFRFLGTFMKI